MRVFRGIGNVWHRRASFELEGHFDGLLTQMGRIDVSVDGPVFIPARTGVDGYSAKALREIADQMDRIATEHPLDEPHSISPDKTPG